MSAIKDIFLKQTPKPNAYIPKTNGINFQKIIKTDVKITRLS